MSVRDQLVPSAIGYMKIVCIKHAGNHYYVRRMPVQAHAWLLAVDSPVAAAHPRPAFSQRRHSAHRQLLCSQLQAQQQEAMATTAQPRPSGLVTAASAARAAAAAAPRGARCSAAAAATAAAAWPLACRSTELQQQPVCRRVLLTVRLSAAAVRPSSAGRPRMQWLGRLAAVGMLVVLGPWLGLAAGAVETGGCRVAAVLRGHLGL